MFAIETFNVQKTYVLGARRTGPENWQVSPGAPELGNISGSLPLQHGELQVSWVSMTLVLNGDVVWADGRARASNISVQTDGLFLSLAGGRYVLACTH